MYVYIFYILYIYAIYNMAFQNKVQNKKMIFFLFWNKTDWEQACRSATCFDIIKQYSLFFKF